MAQQREDANIKADEPTIGLEPSGTEPQTTSLHGQPTEKVGGTIGPYKLLEQLGEGGMGTVYLAEQDRPVRRRVALKIIKPGLDTAQVIARFEAERQALALMDHSNIARVLDAGTTASGRPYFVMEWVQGVPITSYCDQHRLTLRERLALFLPVCRAVQHAHQKGIIHRDLKPSNILVTLRDDQPVPKIIDFGIAKATTQRLTERTLYTQYGQLVGTPDYMSPEQAGMGGIDVDTRSDVYSLGAILYELLCGDTPLGQQRLRQLDFVAMLNVIYEEEPLPPSRRVAELGELATDIARRRDAEPQKLVHALRGELDWIATKALEKERVRRYESPSALATDIERHLNCQPVEASPPSAIYRLQKYIRRNRAALAAAAAIMLVLVGGIIVSGWQAYRATQAEQEMAAKREAALQAEALAETRRRDAENAKQLAETQRKRAEESGAKLASALTKESQARGELERRLREVDAMRLAMHAKDSLIRYPQRALLLAAEAVETTRRKNEPIRSAAHQALREALDNIGGRPMPAHQGSLSFMDLTPNGRWLFTSDWQTVRRWDLADDDPARSSQLIAAPDSGHRAVALSPDGRWLATVPQANNVRAIHLWNLETNKFDQPARQVDLLPQQPAHLLREVVFSPDSSWLAAIGGSTAWLWNLSSQTGAASPVCLQSKNSQFNRIAIGASGKWAVTIDHSGAPTLWSLTETDPDPGSRQLGGSQNSYLRHSEISPDGRWLVAVDSSLTGVSMLGAKVWSLTADDPLPSARALPRPGRPQYGNPQFHFVAHGLLAVSAGDQITLWDLNAEQLQAPVKTMSLVDGGQEESERTSRVTIQSLVSNPDGRWLLAIDDSGLINRWDLRAKDPSSTRIVVGQHPGNGVQLQLSPSGRWLVSMRSGEAPLLWDLARRNSQAAGLELRGHDLGPYSTARAAIGGGKLTALASTPQRIRLPFGLGIVGQTLGLDERWLVTGGGDGALRLWDLKADEPARAGERVGSVKVEGRDLALRPDGKWVALSHGNQVRLIEPPAFDRPEQTVPIRARFFMSSSSSKPLSANGHWAALQVNDQINVYDLENEDLLGKPIDTPPRTNADLARVQPTDTAVWTPAVEAGRWLETFLNPGWPGGTMPDRAAQQPHKIVTTGDSGRFNQFVMGPAGRWIVTQSFNVVRGPVSETYVSSHRWLLHDLQAADPSTSFTDLGELHHPPTFSSDGRWLAACQRDRSRTWLSFWSFGTQPPRSSKHDLGENIYASEQALAFSADGRWLVCGAGAVRVWPIVNDGTLGEPEMLSEFAGDRNVAISQDGSFVAASNGQGIDLWRRNQQTAQIQQQVLHGHEQTIHSLAFSPNGEWLVSASRNGELRLWDLRDEQLQDSMIALNVGHDTGYQRDFSDLLFSPDGHWLAAAAWDGIYFWRLDPAALLDEARRLASRELTDNELAQFRLNTPDRLRERLLRQAAEVSARLEKNPQSVTLLQRRVQLSAAAGDLDAAIDDLRLLARLSPDDHWNYYCLLPLFAQTEQAEEFRRIGQAMMKRFRDPPPENLEVLERTVKGCLFWADSGFDFEEIAPLADQALQKAAEAKHWVVPWTPIAKALAEYRLGNYRAALEWADKGLSNNNASAYSIAVPGNCVKAMAHAQLDQLDEARSALEAAKKAQAAVPAPPQIWSGWNDWYLCDIMLHEADALLLEIAAPETVTAVEPAAISDR